MSIVPRTCLVVCVLLASAGGALPQTGQALLIDDMESPEWRWQGLIPEAQVVRSGQVSGKWHNMPAQPSVSRRLTARETWIHYNTIEFALHSEAANDAAFVLLLFSDNPRTAERDYYIYRMRATWVGWRIVSLSRELFGTQGEPLGWNYLDEFKFSAIGWNCTPSADTVLRLDDIYLTRGGFAAQDGLPIAYFEHDISMWSGFRQSRAHVKEGEFSAKWDLCDTSIKYVKNRSIPHDWSEFDALTVWAYSPVATGATCKIMLYSAEGSDDTSGYFTVLSVDWTGWKRLRFPKWRFNSWHDPAGWHKIDSVMFLSRGWGLSEPPGGTVLYLDQMVVSRESAGADRLVLDDFEQGVDAWQHLASTDIQVHSGSQAARLPDFSQRQQVLTWLVPRDWTQYDALEMWLYSETANHAPLKVVVDADDATATPDESDYYVTTVHLDWSGWRCVRIPKWHLSPCRQPAGWDAVRGLILAGAGWGLTSVPGTVLIVDDVSLVGLVEDGLLVFEDFELGVTQWAGLVECADPIRSGLGAGEWDPLTCEYVTTKAIPDDWRQAQGLSLWVHSSAANGALFRVLLHSDSDETLGHTDTYCHDVMVDWEGWQNIVLRRSDFKISGKPLGWHAIDAVTLRAFGEVGLPEIVLDDLAMVFGGVGTETTSQQQ